MRRYLSHIKSKLSISNYWGNDMVMRTSLFQGKAATEVLLSLVALGHEGFGLSWPLTARHLYVCLVSDVRCATEQPVILHSGAICAIGI